WVLREVGSGTRATFESSLERLGPAPRPLNVGAPVERSGRRCGRGRRWRHGDLRARSERSFAIRRTVSRIDRFARASFLCCSSPRALPLQGGGRVPAHCSRRRSASEGSTAQRLPWLHNAKSGLIYGLGDEAAYIARTLAGDARASLPAGKAAA